MLQRQRMLSTLLLMRHNGVFFNVLYLAPAATITIVVLIYPAALSVYTVVTFCLGGGFDRCKTLLAV